MEYKMYYQDAYINSFTSRPVRQVQDANGDWYVVLEKTAFYPTGGGQPHDMGKLDNKNVFNVEEIEGEIRHYLNEPLDDIRQEVCGVIDWQRRFDHMQQHTGQHILSASFEQLFDYNTVSFHLGTEVVTIDLDTEQLSEAEALRAEELANQIILENRRMETKWVTEEELSHYPLRKETKVKENIRLVIIPDFDYNGCGGTHPKTTGEVRAIKILAWERQRKKVRVQFVCGERVIRQLEQKQRVLLALTKLLNTPEMEMENAVQRLLDHHKSLEKTIEQEHDKLLTYEAKELLGGNCSIVGEVFQDRSIQELQKLARLLTSEREDVIVILVSEHEAQLQLVCARGTGRTESMKVLMNTALPLINGKGGGNETFAQGGGTKQLSGIQMLEHLMKMLTAASAT
ncbi:alanyl-tRNA editing protein [Bacillus sp. BRMEA1]|nr:DHHA1 domain-containing protein [Neobacillus endophyticus]NRD76378.1 alanyl-tRNA editing protein [Neobacillus endophyticus]